MCGRRLQLLQWLLLTASLTAEQDGSTEDRRPPLRRALAVITQRPAHLIPEKAQCAPTRLELTCVPHSGLVDSDGTEQTLRACNPRTCNTRALNIPNGRTSPEGYEFVYVGWKVEIVCNEGYKMDTDSGGSGVLKCQDDCGFDAAPASCAPVKCPIDSVDPNGLAVREEQLPTSSDRAYITFDEYVRVTCNHGFMAGDSAHVYNEPCKVSYIRECLADGSLSNSNLKCIPLTCPPPPNQLDKDGNVAGSWLPQKGVRYKERTSLICTGCRVVAALPGQAAVSAEAARECSWTGQFTPARSTCVDTPCSAQPPSGARWKNGLVPKTCGSTATLQCISSGTIFDMQPLECITEQTYTCAYEVDDDDDNALYDKKVILDRPSKSCVLASCPLSQLLVPNAAPVTSSTDSQTALPGKYGQDYPVKCNAGYRAHASTSRGPVLLVDSPTFRIPCGISVQGQSNYNPCAWHQPQSSGCHLVQCRMIPAPARHTVQPLAPGIQQRLRTTHWHPSFNVSKGYHVTLPSGERVRVACAANNCSCSASGHAVTTSSLGTDCGCNCTATEEFAEYVNLHSRVTTTCNSGYRIAESEEIVSLPFTAKNSSVSVCQEPMPCNTSFTRGCNERNETREMTAGQVCRPVFCNVNVRIPDNAYGIWNNTISNTVPAGTLVRGMAYDNPLTISCIPQYRLAGRDKACSERGYTIRCDNDGKLRYSEVINDIVKLLALAHALVLYYVP